MEYALYRLRPAFDALKTAFSSGLETNKRKQDVLGSHTAQVTFCIIVCRWQALRHLSPTYTIREAYGEIDFENQVLPS